MSNAWTIEEFGESALLVSFGGQVEAKINARTHHAADTLRKLPGIEAATTAYASVLLCFDALHWTQVSELRDAVEAALAISPDANTTATAAIVTLPVCYGGEAGPDLNDVALHTGLSPEEIITRHCAVEYSVAMLGFAPGFPYLLGLDARLVTPRRATPRLRVPTGSVAIGGMQTGIYPSMLPGGWNLIGRTPRHLFDLERDPPALLKAGSRVRFVPISAAELDHLMQAQS